MRLIDADELLKKPLDTANYPSNFVREAKTVEAVSLSVIEKIHTEVGNLEWYGDDAFWDGVNAVTSIIDQAIKEIEHE